MWAGALVRVVGVVALDILGQGLSRRRKKTSSYDMVSESRAGVCVCASCIGPRTAEMARSGGRGLSRI